MMSGNAVLALVVSPSGSLQDGLLALLTTMPQVSAVLVAEEAESALRLVENHQPALALLDFSTPGMGAAFKLIKFHWPAIYLISIAEDTTQQEGVEKAGADCVLLKGFSAQKLVRVIDEFLEAPEERPLIQAGTEGEDKR